MLKIVNNGFKEPVWFEYESDGVKHQLKIIQRSVKHEAGLQKALRESNTDDQEEKVAKYIMAKIAFSIETEGGDRFFNVSDNLPFDVASKLLEEVGKLNPEGVALEEAKKKS